MNDLNAPAVHSGDTVARQFSLMAVVRGVVVQAARDIAAR